MKRNEREREKRRKHTERRKTDGKKRKGSAGKRRMDRVIGTRWREKERKCKKDVTQYVGYRGTRACERIVSTGRARTIARGISGLNRSSSHDLARISLLEDSESETTGQFMIVMVY